MKLTKQNLPAIEAAFAEKVAEKKVDDAIFFDDDLKRFGLRMRSSGRRSWVVQYEKSGRSWRVTLGNAAVITPDQARHLAKQELAKVDLGTNVAVERAEAKVKEKRLFKSVLEQYLAALEIDLRQAKLRQSTFTEITRYLTKTFKGLHHKPIGAIQRIDIAAILRDKANTSPTAAAAAQSILTTFFGWCVGEGFIEVNPVIGTNRYKVGKARERVLFSAELARVWNACGDDDYGRIVRLLILTGARRDEIGGMQWAELDIDNRTWTLPGDRAKNHRALKLTLPGLAWEIIESIERREFNKHLFGIGRDGFNNWPPPRLR